MIDAGTLVIATQEITVAIFGRWANRTEIMARLVDESSQNSSDGVTLINKKSGKVIYELDVHKRDFDLVNSVVSCGAGRLNASNIEAVRDHTHYIVLTGPVGTVANQIKSQLEAAVDMLNAVSILVQELNGSVVHVATAGITHPSEAWVAMSLQQDNTAIVNAFVQRIGGSGEFFSCGMHALGFADACLKEAIPAADGAKVLFEFLLHSLRTRLDPQGSSFIFRARSVSGSFRAISGKCTEWDEESTFYNRFGTWTLTRT
jgi:hypothetical protein